MSVDVDRFRAIQLRLLDAVSVMCKDADVPWILWAGTLLGAVRHADGFIPWDDDLDIALMRRDFDALMRRILVPDGFDFVDKVWPAVNCARISVKGTTAVDLHDMGYSSGHIDKPYQGAAGVYCDIFPLDYVPDDPGMGDKFVKQLCPGPQWNIPDAREKHYKLSVSCGITQHVSATIVGDDHVPVDAIFPTKPLNIRGRDYSGPSDPDKVLSCLYGDWRTPPPEDRRNQHAMFIDLDHDWREYVADRILPPCVKKA